MCIPTISQPQCRHQAQTFQKTQRLTGLGSFHWQGFRQIFPDSPCSSVDVPEEWSWWIPGWGRSWCWWWWCLGFVLAGSVGCARCQCWVWGLLVWAVLTEHVCLWMGLLWNSPALIPHLYTHATAHYTHRECKWTWHCRRISRDKSDSRINKSSTSTASLDKSLMFTDSEASK